MSIVTSGLTSTSCYAVTGDTTGKLVFNVNNNGSNGGTTALTLDANSYASFTSSLQTTSLGIGTAASGVVGEIRAANNITAYYSSDVRLKKNIVPIENALASNI